MAVIYELNYFGSSSWAQLGPALQECRADCAHGEGRWEEWGDRRQPRWRRYGSNPQERARREAGSPPVGNGVG